MCDACNRDRQERIDRANLTRNIDFYESIIDNMEKTLHAFAEIMVDAELITRSRCHELTGMSHSDIGKLLANSPIAKDAAKQCINIADAHAYSCGCSGLIVADIVETFHLSV